MKKKLLTLTLSALLLCSTGVIASAKEVTQAPKATPTVQLAALTHYWYAYKTLDHSYVDTEYGNGGMHRTRTVLYYNILYVCTDCGAQKTGSSTVYGDWSAWTW